MGALPTPIRMDSKATGNSADGQITRNVVDDAFAAMSSKLLLLMRADKISVTSSNIIDAMGNPLTQVTSGLSKLASDPNFNSQPSITQGNQTNQYTASANSIGNPSAGTAVTNSFTVLTGIRYPSSPSSANSLYGDNAGTTDSGNITGFYLDGSGNLKYSIGLTTFQQLAAGLVAAGNTYVLWISYDAVTGIFRAGVNSPAVVAQLTQSVKRNGASSSTVCHPFGYSTSGGSGNISWHRWALFNKAFLNGSVPADDAQFSALVNLYATFI